METETQKGERQERREGGRGGEEEEERRFKPSLRSGPVSPAGLGRSQAQRTNSLCKPKSG